MNKETILTLLKSLTNPEVEKGLLAGGSVLNYEQLFKTLAPFLITILDTERSFSDWNKIVVPTLPTIPFPATISSVRVMEESDRGWQPRDLTRWSPSSSPRTAMGIPTLRNPIGDDTYDYSERGANDIGSGDHRCIP